MRADIELMPKNIPQAAVSFVKSVLPMDLKNIARAGHRHLNPRSCLKALAMFRLVNPTADIRIAGGREMHLGSMQCLGLYAASSIFVGDYLTTRGQPPESDYRMIEEMGFVIAGGRKPAHLQSSSHDCVQKTSDAVAAG